MKSTSTVQPARSRAHRVTAEPERAPLGRVDRKVAELASLEEVVTVRMDAIRADLNTRMLAVEQEVHGMRHPIEQMARDLAAVVELLPSPSDGPLARLRDTLTAN